MVYFCAFACSEIFQKNARELGVGRGQFHSGVNGLMPYKKWKTQQLALPVQNGQRCCSTAEQLQEALPNHCQLAGYGSNKF